MATILKCKMCGGDIEVNKDMTVGTCLFCGSTMTLPRIDTDKKARLFNRANDYRLNCEFDKAYDAYKTIVEEDEQEAEAYWGMILSEYGVEYVEDPTSKKRIPTCHRTHIQPIRTSTNYKMAVQYADSESKFLYQDEAEVLDNLQKNIISISSKEAPYDVFICYKETDDTTGERTKDSVLAEDIYNALTDKGVRTFFSRISLEEHIGENYEPYIYSALNSARVMLLVTTSNKHCNAVWVKNEWMRFLQFMQDDKSKVIIPAYSEMTAYELPDELVSVQGQDLGKLGAIQDTVRGILKLLDKAPASSNDKALNELIADKMQREEKKDKLKRISAFLVSSVALLISSLVFLYRPLFYNGYTYFDLKDMWRYHRHDFLMYGGLLALAVGLLWISVVLVLFLRKRRIALVFQYIAGGSLVASIAFGKYSSLTSKGTIPLVIAFLVIWVGFAFFFIHINWKNCIILSLVVITCVVALIIPIKKLTIANADYISAYNQVIIKVGYANVRETSSTNSRIMCQVYSGMVFDIVSSESNEGYTWYKIVTSEGIEGYLREDVLKKAVKLSVSDEFVNVREKPSAKSNKVGELHQGDVYYGVSDGTWIKIMYNGESAYVYEDVVKVIK